jgi:hypothetical protein
VPNPTSGLETVGIVHPASPMPWVQLVGCLPGVVGTRQICQNTVRDEVPLTVAKNCTVPFRLTVAVDPAPAAAEVTVIPTGVEFPPQPATQAASSAVAPNLHNLILIPPNLLTAINPPLSLRERSCNFDTVRTVAIRKSVRP